eukprot:TRINITY_DN4827_c0_g1_i2.p2 TRINITY_DN4827_c0_g1~~TRINITY_DN4827_c0_g1_i2.p2  ORF type:complete len:124 (-),score=1.25 TRINITY_DN4827_c0_g1_i2:406-777(-)
MFQCLLIPIILEQFSLLFHLLDNCFKPTHRSSIAKMVDKRALYVAIGRRSILRLEIQSVVQITLVGRMDILTTGAILTTQITGSIAVPGSVTIKVNTIVGVIHLQVSTGNIVDITPKVKDWLM